MDLPNLFEIFSCEVASQGEVKRFLKTTEIFNFLKNYFSIMQNHM